MNQKVFPGSSKALNKSEQRARQLQQKSEQAAKNKELDKKMGTMARLAIARRGFYTFTAVALLSVALGSATWGISKAAIPEKTLSYPDAFKNAYNIKNLGDKDKAFDTTIAMLWLIVAAIAARANVNNNKKRARKLTRNIESDRYCRADIDVFNSRMLSTLYREQNKDSFTVSVNDKMDAIARAIIKKFASENPEFFENVLANRISRITRDYAITVIEGHLKSHPEDFEKLLDAYVPESLPKSLVRKYGQKNR